MRRLVGMISLVGAISSVLAMPPLPNSLYVGAHGGAAIPGGNGTHTWQTGYLLSGEFGYRFDRVRVEGQSTFVRNHPQHTAAWNYNTLAYLGNVYYDIPISDMLMPYFGAGMGLVQRWQSATAYSSSTSNVFGFQFITGLGLNLSAQWMLDFRYRYLASTGSQAATNGLEFGLNYTFN